MMPIFLKRLLSLFRRSQPDPKVIAQQLRKPSGEFAPKVAAKMDRVNAPLFDLTLESMQLSDGESVLEIGFGSGSFFDKIFQQANRLQVCGVDYSEDMVRQATERNKSLITSQKLTVQVADSNDLPFPENTFDKVFCNMVVFFWDHPGDHLQEIKRVLKPNGKFYTGIRSKESMKNFPFTQYGFTLYDEDEWSAVLRENGFAVTGVQTRSDIPMEMDDQEVQMESICIAAQPV